VVATTIRMALLVVGLAACAVYLSHTDELSPAVGAALGVLVVAVIAPREGMVRGFIVAAALTGVLGLVVVWLAQGDDHARRVLRTLGWTEAALAAWWAYVAGFAASSARNGVTARLDEAARARWQQGDMTFSLELAARIVVRAQPSWAALVIETAWPEPRPAAVEKLVTTAADASGEAAAAMRLMIEGDDARAELVRIACDVVREAQGRPAGDCGGPAASRLILKAAEVAQDDAHAVRIFSALVLPAIAGTLERRPAAE
jgi:hypothetical protein